MAGVEDFVTRKQLFYIVIILHNITVLNNNNNTNNNNSWMQPCLALESSFKNILKKMVV